MRRTSRNVVHTGTTHPAGITAPIATPQTATRGPATLTANVILEKVLWSTQSG